MVMDRELLIEVIIIGHTTGGVPYTLNLLFS